MPAPPPPLNLSSQYGPYGVFIAPAGDASPLLDPGERLGGPPPRRRRRTLRMVGLLALAGGLAWVAIERQDDVRALTALASAALSDLQQSRQLPPAPPREEAKLPDPAPVAEREVAPSPVMHVEEAAPGAKPSPEDASPAPAQEETAPDAPKTAPPERLPTVTVDPADPLQQKALAAGLHPGLSRTLLDRLTPEDFRNAAHAVKAALSAEASAPPIVWPRQKAAQRAQFKVRLVAGAPAECRRYVVQIAKDGWETTARPMERCTARQAFKPT